MCIDSIPLIHSATAATVAAHILRFTSTGPADRPIGQAGNKELAGSRKMAFKLIAQVGVHFYLRV